MFSEVLTIIAPVLVIALVGYIWERRGMPFDMNAVTAIVTEIAAPALLLDVLLRNRPDLLLMARVVAAAVLMAAITGAVAWVILRAIRQPVRVFLPAMVFPNTGNMGLPLCLFAFGDTGLALAVAYFAAMTVLQFSVGISIASGTVSWRTFVANRPLIAIVIAAVLIQTGVVLPKWLGNSIAVLGSMMIPLMLFSLGISLASLRVTAIHRSLAFSVFRLASGFLAAVGVCRLLGLEGAARGVVVVQSTMASAIFNYLFAARYDTRPEEVAGIVFISTVLTFLLLPLLMAFVL